MLVQCNLRAYLTLLVLGACGLAAVWVPASTRRRPLALLFLGLLVVALCTWVPLCCAVPLATLLVVLWLYGDRSNGESEHEMRHDLVSDAEPYSYSREELKEGFAVAEKMVRSSIADQRNAAARLQADMGPAKLNANAIARAMENFQRVRSRSDEYWSKRDKLRRKIELVQEKYTAADSNKGGDRGAHMLQRRLASAK